MERTFVAFPILDLSTIRQRLLTWADSRFDVCCFLDNHHYEISAHSVECLLAAGVVDKVHAGSGSALPALAEFAATKKDWMFGHIGYGLSRETEPWAGSTTTGEALPDEIGFPDLFFFVPEYVIELLPGQGQVPAPIDTPETGGLRSTSRIRIGSLRNDHAAVLEQILSAPFSASAILPAIPAPKPRFARDEYLDTVRKLQKHILRGDCYEINFCQEFYSSPAHIDPLQTWFSLSNSSPNPFSAYYKIGASHLLCASPERYLKRSGGTILSQPIKGTWPRTGNGSAREVADDAARSQLYHSSKDRSENVMIVDLVRNDLSRLCVEGTVEVEELYGIYTFPQVHQMISTIKGELIPGISLVDCIRATFPMGSMTGAPKNRVVRLIADVERTPRGIFSGAVGYMTPEGGFDLNVVIRSIMYNDRNKYLSYQVGSGITFYSDPLLEYEECLLKAEGMKMALGLHHFVE
ncbi:MAG: anthranilate synthase component I family protein [Bacteroidota bacterium]|nr:anthranilate synthase component I family protein [Bacteroidota bacterium]MDP4215422.1 anthranilate synthase component I family protein [Bacteroidota bacterium]MDP4245910.1 anthranilate synthase component I family protein [Bacteroidota bacterium]MDP4254831.1 anthranilate synthase component I family protein [Bacteroidota bacterium]MDP4256736.1 anthranilate synthase component I family protein [Bacteroidota bacterium]